MTAEMCPGCFHSISWHYNDVRGVARCRADYQPPRTQGLRESLYGGIPCDCTDFKSGLAEQRAATEKRIKDEEKAVVDRIVEHVREVVESSETPKLCTTSGDPVDQVRAAQAETQGQHKSYVVLCAEERAKGFVRPYRDSYKHIGIRPRFPLRDLTDEERAQHGKYGYVKYEEYPESESPHVGRFWTEADLRSGCGTVTTMGRAISETYARDPAFYGATFCCGCNKHLSVGEFVWTADGEVVGS